MRQNPILNKRRKEEPIVDEAMSWKGKARNKVLPRISLPEGRQNRVSGKNALAVEELQKVEHRHDAGSLGERKDTNRNVGYANPKDQSSTIRTVLMSKEPDKAPDTGQCIVLEGVLQKQHSVAKTKKSSLMIRPLRLKKCLKMKIRREMNANPLRRRKYPRGRIRSRKR